MTMSALSEGAVRGVASLDLRRGPYPCSIWHERTVRKCDTTARVQARRGTVWTIYESGPLIIFGEKRSPGLSMNVLLES